MFERYGKGILKGMSVTIRHLLRIPITTQYPEQRLNPSRRTRGNELIWNQERCTGCGTCAKTCPQGSIDIMTSAKIEENKYKVEQFEKEAPYAWIIPKDQWDVPTAANLVDGMRFAGLDVYEAEEAFESDGKSYSAGTWVIPMNQPFSRFIKACWEKQVYPDLTKYPKQWQGIVRPQVFKDAYLPPYDMAGWTLPHQFGVKVAEAQTPVKAKLKHYN